MSHNPPNTIIWGGDNYPLMSRISFIDDDDPGAGVEGRKPKKGKFTREQSEREEGRKLRNFGDLKFDKKKNADIFESEPR